MYDIQAADLRKLNQWACLKDECIALLDNYSAWFCILLSSWIIFCRKRKPQIRLYQWNDPTNPIIPVDIQPMVQLTKYKICGVFCCLQNSK